MNNLFLNKNLVVVAGAAIAVTVWMARFGGTTPAQADQQGALPEATSRADAAQLARLLAERLEVLRKLSIVAEQQYRAGHVGHHIVLQASREALQASLDVSHNRAERIAVRQSYLEQMTKLEGVAEARLQTSFGSSLERLAVIAQRLDAEIELLREQAAE